MISQPAVPTSSTNGIANVATNSSGATAYVTAGANGATMSNYWVNAASVATSAAAYMMTVPNGQTCALQYANATPIWFWSEYTPALPASTVSATNITGRDLTVVFVGSGSVSAVKINGVTTNIVQAPATYTAGTPLPKAATIAVTYSGTVAWAWLDPISLVLPNSNGVVYAQPDTVTSRSPLTTLPYAPHSLQAVTNGAVAVSN